ncbi:5'-methylthioadenosine/S-adenosylhomocysteine nucleosidase, partial [Candidatus Gracilibacteria bacterium]|nr:5'-methylthioadenosine/S-adenosylhomocysteine nucleosidase [Candidatus Gracilibacteria bacterium]
GVKKNDSNEDENIVLAVCGEGKIHSAFATSYICENYSFEKIINIGIVGNLNHDIIKVGDVILPNTFVQHDFYMPLELDFSKELRAPIFIDYAVGEDYDLEKFQLHLNGICATGDQFIDNIDLQAEIHEKFGADIVDMEAYSILSVLKQYDMLDRTLVIKAVSDGANDESKDSTMNNLNSAMQNAFAILDFTL